MMYNLNIITVGSLQVNCCLLYCVQTKEALIIDPGDESRKIIDKIDNLKLVPKLIVNTHGHYDHIGANDIISEKYKIPIAIHSEDSIMLTSDLNQSLLFGINFKCKKANTLLKNNDEIVIGKAKIRVIHTPGHTPGGICILAENMLFSGDTLFNKSVGRTDFPRGSSKQLIKNIKEKLFLLPNKTVVYPGHGENTTIGYEKEYNPFII